jgi:hypothetical protein
MFPRQLRVHTGTFCPSPVFLRHRFSSVTGFPPSPVFLRALLAAKDQKLKTIAFLGRDGGDCGGLADVELLVAGKATARIQEGHKFLLHTICELVEDHLASAG